MEDSLPLYEYKCPSCQHEFEKILKFSEFDNPINCEKCQQVADRQIPNGVKGTTTAQPWEYAEVHKANGGRGPNYVRDSDGNRHKFDPSVHIKGRKGAG